MEKKKVVSQSPSMFFKFAAKLADLFILSMAWIVCSLPVFTIITSTAALYYSVVKTVRKECGSPLKEFFRAFKTNLKQGIFLSLISLSIAVLVVYNIYSADLLTENEPFSTFYALFSRGLLLLCAFFIRYLFAILSRFQMSIKQYIKVSCTMAIKHMPTTLLLTILLVVAIEIVFVFPFLLIITPGAIAYFDSLLIERVFKRYMPQTTTGDEVPWYWL